jgi:hypothetical protein
VGRWPARWGYFLGIAAVNLGYSPEVTSALPCAALKTSGEEASLTHHPLGDCPKSVEERLAPEEELVLSRLGGLSIQ